MIEVLGNWLALMRIAASHGHLNAICNFPCRHPTKSMGQGKSHVVLVSFSGLPALVLCHPPLSLLAGMHSLSQIRSQIMDGQWWPSSGLPELMNGLHQPSRCGNKGN